MVTSDDSAVRVWDVASRTMRSEFLAPLGGYWAIAVSPDGSTAAAVDVTGGLNLVSLTDGHVLTTFEGSVDWASNVEVSPDGRAVAVGGRDDSVIVWYPPARC